MTLIVLLCSCLNFSWANMGMILCSIASAAEHLLSQTTDGYFCTAMVTRLRMEASSRSRPAPHTNSVPQTQIT